MGWDDSGQAAVSGPDYEELVEGAAGGSLDEPEAADDAPATEAVRGVMVEPSKGGF